MTLPLTDVAEASRLADVTRLDRARFVKEARRLRREQIDRLLRRLARSWRAPAPRHGAMSDGMAR